MMLVLLSVARAALRPSLLAVPALALLLLAGACAQKGTKIPPGTDKPDQFLFERGTTALKEKRWFTAREFFQTLIDTYPQSPHRADAKLGLADAYLGDGSPASQVLAINEYREFLSFYPIHPRAHYAQFKLGMCHFYRMHGPDRDQTETVEAIAELTLFLQRYPNPQENPLLEEGRARLREARDRLSDSDYRVAYFYLRTQKFPPAAIDRLNAILKNDPEYSRRDAVYFHLAQALLRVNRPAEALPYLDRLITEFEVSEYLEEAKKLAETLKTDMKKAKTGSVSHES
jgi:outer membrane protein assembly factor BamD